MPRNDPLLLGRSPTLHARFCNDSVFFGIMERASDDAAFPKQRQSGYGSTAVVLCRIPNWWEWGVHPAFNGIRVLYLD